MNKNTSKILFLDLETKPGVVYTFDMFKPFITPDHIIEAGGTICVGAKWLHERKTMFFSDWTDGHEEMLKKVHELMSEADAIITYNGDRFDLPKLMGEFLMVGLKPPAPPTSIDLYKTVKKMGFVMNRLAFIGPFLKIGAKVKHEGFSLWKSVIEGDEKARARMEKYCLQDVALNEKLYKRIKPYIKNHPHLGTENRGACGACGSNHVQSRGYRTTKYFKIQRLQCQACGSWHDGARTKIDNGRAAKSNK